MASSEGAPIFKSDAPVSPPDDCRNRRRETGLVFCIDVTLVVVIHDNVTQYNQGSARFGARQDKEEGWVA